MNIEIRGLTERQRVLCDILWALDTEEAVTNFIHSLPKDFATECLSLIEMIKLAATDLNNDTDLASELLQGLKKK